MLMLMMMTSLLWLRFEFRKRKRCQRPAPPPPSPTTNTNANTNRRKRRGRERTRPPLRRRALDRGHVVGSEAPALLVQGVEGALARGVGRRHQPRHVGARQLPVLAQRVLQHVDDGLLQRDDLRLQAVLGRRVAHGEPPPVPLVPVVEGATD